MLCDYCGPDAHHVRVRAINAHLTVRVCPICEEFVWARYEAEGTPPLPTYPGRRHAKKPKDPPAH